MEKTVPYSIAAERDVLGSILFSPQSIAYVADFLKPEHFYRDIYGAIYQVMLSLSESGRAIDFLAIEEAFSKLGRLDDIDNGSLLYDLAGEVPTTVYVEPHARVIVEKWKMRNLFFAAGKIAALALAEDEHACEKAEQLIFDLGIPIADEDADLIDLSDIMLECTRDIDKAHESRHMVVGVPTGYKDMDAMLGGLQPANLVFIAARPSMGKTVLGMNIAYYAARRGKRVAVFSLEMGRRQLGNRLISMLTGIPTQRLRNGWIEEDEWDAIVAAQDHLASLPISIDDTSGSPVVSIRSKVQRLQIRKREKVDLIVVDYLQLMEPPDEGSKPHYENRVQEITQISRGLKRLAKHFDCPVLAMAQLSRKVEERQIKIPQLADLRDSGSLEQDADVVMFVYRDEYYAGFDKDGHSKSDRPGTADIIVAKQRDGDVGEFPLRFIGKRTRFYNMDDAEMPR